MKYLLTAEQLNILKAKVKTEMARRKGYGTINNYSTTAYDFNVKPTQGQPIIAEHGQKTIDLLLQIKDKGDLKLVKQGDAIPDSWDASLLTYVDNLSLETMEGGVSSCRGACTGLCLGTCSGGCGGCVGTCTSGCSGCSGCGGCTNSCNGCTSCQAGCNGCTGCSSCSGGCAA